MARGSIRLVHGLTKCTLITYFSGMKIDHKYVFLHAFFLIFLSCSFQNLSIWPKNTPFFPLLHVFAPLNDVRAYSAWSWKTTLITWIFGLAWYPLDIRVAPPPRGVCRVVFSNCDGSIAFSPPWLSENPMPEVGHLASAHLYRWSWTFQVSSFLAWESRALDWILVHPHYWNSGQKNAISFTRCFQKSFNSLLYRSLLVIYCCQCTLRTVLNLNILVYSF